jgi:hypothetical protein
MRAAAGAVLARSPLDHLVSVGLLSRTVANRPRFVLGEVIGRGRVVAHRVRPTGIQVLLEHGSEDIHVVDEILYRRIYELPAEV